MRRRSAPGPGVTTTHAERLAGASLSHWLERRHERWLLRRRSRGARAQNHRGRWSLAPPRGVVMGAAGLLLLSARRSALLMIDTGLRAFLPPPPPPPPRPPSPPRQPEGDRDGTAGSRGEP